MRLHADRGGAGDDLLLLVHGLGATAAVWRPLLATAAERWPGRWLAPDLRGHGASPMGSAYTLGTFAADLADLLAEEPPSRRLVVLGHSLGGAVALALASGWFGPQPACVLGLGIKSDWDELELARLHDVAARPARRFATPADAWARYARVIGIDPAGSGSIDILARGVVPDGDGWRLAADPRANAIQVAPMAALAAAAGCPLHLACGAGDVMVPLATLAPFDPGAVALAGCGHNAMVDDPDAVWAWLAMHAQG